MTCFMWWQRKTLTSTWVSLVSSIINVCVCACDTENFSQLKRMSWKQCKLLSTAVQKNSIIKRLGADEISHFFTIKIHLYILTGHNIHRMFIYSCVCKVCRYFVKFWIQINVIQRYRWSKYSKILQTMQ